MNRPVRISDRTRSSTVAKALRVLDALVDSESALGLSELARACGYDKATTLRLLRSLIDVGVVVQVDDRRYEPGLRLVRIGAMVAMRRSMVAIVHPWLERLSEATGQTAVAGVLEGTEMVNVGQVDGVGELRAGRSLGERWPVHVSASGKAILAHLDPGAAAAVLDRCVFTRYTDATIVDRERFERDLDAVRQRGWGQTIEERSPGVSSIGAPVYDASDQVTGAIGIVGWSGRFTQAYFTHAAEIVIQTAAAVSSELGRPSSSLARQGGR